MYKIFIPGVRVDILVLVFSTYFRFSYLSELLKLLIVSSLTQVILEHILPSRPSHIK